MKKNILKKAGALALVGAMMTGMAVNVSAGTVTAIGEFLPHCGPVGYYEAYCGYSDGYASTVVYLDSYVTTAEARVDMTLYSIDEYFYKYMSEENKDLECEAVRSANTYAITYNAMAEAYVELGGAVWSEGERKYHAYKVESRHEVEADVLGAALDCIVTDLVAKY